MQPYCRFSMAGRDSRGLCEGLLGLFQRAVYPHSPTDLSPGIDLLQGRASGQRVQGSLLLSKPSAPAYGVDLASYHILVMTTL